MNGVSCLIIGLSRVCELLKRFYGIFLLGSGLTDDFYTKLGWHLIVELIPICTFYTLVGCFNGSCKIIASGRIESHLAFMTFFKRSLKRLPMG